MIDTVSFGGFSGGGGNGGGSATTVVANYSALPDPTTVANRFYWCRNSEGTKWLPFSLGGTYFSAGMYYSNGVTWEFQEVPFQASQAVVDAGVNLTQFVNASTLSNTPKVFNAFQKNIDTTDDITEGLVNKFASDPLFSDQAFDVTNDTLPIISPSVDVLNVDFENFNGDIDLTGQLPLNLKTGARVTIRKYDSTNGKIIFNDGVILYNFINKQGEYLTLFWNGTKYII